MRKHFVVVGASVFGAKRPDATEVIGNRKAALVRCYERDVANRADPAIRHHHVRFSVNVAASGKVQEVHLPQWDPTNPIWEPTAAGSPRPNPMNVGKSAVRCIEAQVRRLHFAAADGFSTIAIDVRTMPR